MAGEQYLIGNIPTNELEERAQIYRNVVTKGLDIDMSYEEFHEVKESAAALRAVEKELELRRQGGRGITKLGSIVREDGAVVGVAIKSVDDDGSTTVHHINGNVYIA